ncbi:hypothetical protein TNCV_4069771 [Trichonephila clavipes]|nr:hypothetical protein TNCV_4069771 [Trichonephila clavipes]
MWYFVRPFSIVPPQTRTHSRTTVMVSFLDVTGIKPCPDLSPNQNARLATVNHDTCCPVAVELLSNDAYLLTAVGLFRLQDDISVIPCSCRLRATTISQPFLTAVLVVWNAFQARENDTFVDSELCSYTGDGTPLLQLSDHSSTWKSTRFNILKDNGDGGSNTAGVVWKPRNPVFVTLRQS